MFADPDGPPPQMRIGLLFHAGKIRVHINVEYNTHMSKPELALSNTTSFFLGNIETLFKNAKKHGFKYLEIIPYRWTTAEQILKLQNAYGIQVVGVHMPSTTWQASWPALLRRNVSLWEKFWGLVFYVYLGKAINSPGIKIASLLDNPYLLIHSNIAKDMGKEFEQFQKKIHVAIENIPSDKTLFAGGVFDHGHFNESRLATPSLNLQLLYGEAKPEVIHISYNSRFVHLLPNQKEQDELKQLLQIHQPKYIVIETNPLVSIKKAKLLLEKILNPQF